MFSWLPTNEPWLFPRERTEKWWFKLLQFESLHPGWGVHGEGLGKGQRGGSWWHLVREGVFGGHVGEGAGLWQLCLASLTCPPPPGTVRPQPAGVQRVHRQPGWAAAAHCPLRHAAHPGWGGAHLRLQHAGWVPAGGGLAPLLGGALGWDPPPDAFSPPPQWTRWTQRAHGWTPTWAGLAAWPAPPRSGCGSSVSVGPSPAGSTSSSPCVPCRGSGTHGHHRAGLGGGGQGGPCPPFPRWTYLTCRFPLPIKGVL